MIFFSASKITLKGCSTNVELVFKQVEKQLLEFKMAVILSKQVLWKWKVGNNKEFTSLPLRVSKEIEQLYEV